MPNFNGSGSINQPLAAAGIPERGSNEGVMYAATTAPRTVTAGSFLSLQLSNPTTANRTARVASVDSGAQISTVLFYVRNGTLNGGVALSAFNENSSYSDVSQMIPSFSISTVNPVTGGVTLTSVFQAAGPAENVENGRIVVPPGGRFIVTLQNAQTTALLNVSVSWIEI
ncbi:hypothetical protein [Paenibacillus methanolicus]|uniref:Uncharacterized protein n=1 Tax=Paenibacillus methanolicus TaxID=582686 RepID=A0A5S5CDE2_9BACL|nr:hypothetical protein [Paenibacillus methanolicus]TYP76346.1 hypothetical protein BCM02_1037 [Paenibacillus methanolicus]